MAGGEIIRPEPIAVRETVDRFSQSLRAYLLQLGLPAQNILVDVEERGRIITNLPAIVETLPEAHRLTAFYISKFIAACGAGLFDAALNFLWDEVVANLRSKVMQFDLEYFFDSAISNPQERARYNTEDDLKQLDDWSLVKGCQVCGIITDIGYKHLNYIRDMRNWASAAHPNQYQLRGFQLLDWLETCIREVLSKEIEGPVVEVRRLLRNLREQVLTIHDVPAISASVQRLPPDLATALLRSAFGHYTDPQIGVQVRNNVGLIAPSIWAQAPEDVRYEIGLKYSNFSVNGDVARRDLARQFLGAVNGLVYMPASQLAVEIQDRVENLLTVHEGWDNFYHEVPAARELKRLIPVNGEIPVAINGRYVFVVTLCRVGRPSGISRGAVAYYDQMIELYQDRQIREFVKLLSGPELSNLLTYAGCARRFRNIAEILRPRTANPRLQAPLDLIVGATDAQLPNLGRDIRYQRLLADVA